MSATHSHRRSANKSNSGLCVQLYNPKKPAYSSRITVTQWNRVKPLLQRLHQSGCTRNDMLDVLASEHDFRPSKNQLQKRMALWGYNERVADPASHQDTSEHQLHSSSVNDDARELQANSLEEPQTLGGRLGFDTPNDGTNLFADLETGLMDDMSLDVQYIERLVKQNCPDDDALNGELLLGITYWMIDSSIGGDLPRCILKFLLFKSVTKSWHNLWMQTLQIYMHHYKTEGLPKDPDWLTKMLNQHTPSKAEVDPLLSDEVLMYYATELRKLYALEDGIRSKSYHRNSHWFGLTDDSGSATSSKSVLVYRYALVKVNRSDYAENGYSKQNVKPIVLTPFLQWCRSILRWIDFDSTLAEANLDAERSVLEQRIFVRVFDHLVSNWIAFAQESGSFESYDTSIDEMAMFQNMIAILGRIARMIVSKAQKFFTGLEINHYLDSKRWCGEAEEVVQMAVDEVLWDVQEADVDMESAPQFSGGFLVKLLQEPVTILSAELFRIQQDPTSTHHNRAVSRMSEIERVPKAFTQPNSTDPMLWGGSTTSSLSLFRRSRIKLDDKYGPPSVSGFSYSSKRSNEIGGHPFISASHVDHHETIFPPSLTASSSLENLRDEPRNILAGIGHFAATGI